MLGHRAARPGPATRGRQEDAMAHDPQEVRAFAECYTAAWCSMDPAQVAEYDRQLQHGVG